MGVWVDSTSSDCLAQPGHLTCWGLVSWCPWLDMLHIQPAAYPVVGGNCEQATYASALWLAGVPLGLSAPFWKGDAVVPVVVLSGLCALDVWAPISLMSAFEWVCCSPHTLLSILMEKPCIHRHAHTHTHSCFHLGVFRYFYFWAAVAPKYIWY